MVQHYYFILMWIFYTQKIGAINNSFRNGPFSLEQKPAWEYDLYLQAVFFMKKILLSYGWPRKSGQLWFSCTPTISYWHPWRLSPKRVEVGWLGTHITIKSDVEKSQPTYTIYTGPFCQRVHLLVLSRLAHAQVTKLAFNYTLNSPHDRETQLTLLFYENLIQKVNPSRGCMSYKSL